MEASGSRKGKVGVGDGDDIPTVATFGVGREILPRKLDLPVFNGDNPDGWLFRVERYFEINNLTFAKKCRATVVCLEGEALAWYYYKDGRRGFRGWSGFSELMRELFRISQEGTLLDQLFALQ